MGKGQKTDEVRQIYLLRPEGMDVVIDKETGLVKEYKRLVNGKWETIPKEEIIHFKMPNPMDPSRGMGPVQAARVYIETEEYSSSWTKNSIFNSGRPSGIVNIKGTMNDDQFKSMKRQFADSYSGTKNAGKTMLLKGNEGVEFTKLGMELQEVTLRELKNMTRDDIMVMFKVSKTILGISDDVNRANALEARAVFIRNVVMPELDRFIDTINAFLMPTIDPKAVLKYEDPNLQSDEDRLNEWEKGFNKWLTINDIRKERGLKPIPGGDVLYQSLALVPVDENSAIS